jgi:HD-GYP domain-containing protein (c-di-GMP phosphodiesterase class II)
VGDDRDRAQVRLAELLSALSLGIDLGFGQPMEHVLRQVLIALRLAELLELDEQQRAVVYYTALLVNVGCHSDAHEQAKWFGDDIGLKATKYGPDARSLASVVSVVRRLGSGNPPLHRLRIGLEFAVSGRREILGVVAEHARIAASLSERLELPEGVSESLIATYERWDGRGWPGVLSGAEIPLAARISQFAEYVEVAHRVGGNDEALRVAGDRSGRQFDPALCELLVGHRAELLEDLDDEGAWDTVIRSEPSLGPRLCGRELDQALEAVADFVDLKSPYTLGHSGAVAALAGGAAETLGLGDADVALVRRSALLHDIGRLGVSNAIWDKARPLGAGERERIRLYPYLTQRILSQSVALAPLAAVAVQHRERLDGSGYPSGLGAASLPLPARILAVADAYQTWSEPRPHRVRLSPADATARLRAEGRAGRLDADAVEAVLGAAGHRTAHRRSRPAGLSPREIEILRLIARGMSSRQIAERLTLSPKTVRNHTEHIYAKTGAVNRVSASLFAVEHGLLPGE